MFNLYKYIVLPSFSIFFTITTLLERCSSNIMCSSDNVDLSLQIISRVSAGLIYPSMFMVFFSKFRYITTLLSKSFLAEIFDFSKLHKNHIQYSLIIWYSSIIHSIAHIIRLFYRNEDNLIITNIISISGLVSLLLTVLIIPPMYYNGFKRISYEIRKTMHYLFAPYLISLYFHKFRLGLFSLSLLILYITDTILTLIYSTFKVNDIVFHILKRGIVVEFDTCKNMVDFSGKNVYINFPWISIFEWHVFSVIEDYERNKALIYIESVGDWSKIVYEKCYNGNNKPKMWISGPYPSPYSNYDNYKNITMISSGSGIIPSISIIEKQIFETKIQSVLITRDFSLIDFFLPYFKKLDSYTIFYTGKLDDNIRTKYKKDLMINLGRPNICKILLEIGNLEASNQIEEIKENEEEVSISFMNKNNINPYLDNFNDKLIMYCGSSKTLKKNIKSYCQLNKINYVFESFSKW